MAREPAVRERNPWLPLFILSVAALAGALAALAWVLLDLISDGETRDLDGAQPDPGGEPVAAVSGRLSYSGALPRAAESLGLEPVEAGKTPDVVFAASGPGEDAVAVRYFVPVASLGAGVDALTASQLRDIFTGESGDWREAGGIPGPIRLLAPSAEDLAAYGPLVTQGRPELLAGVARVDGYGALRKEMAVDSRVIAIVPVEELGPLMVAIAIDGADLARGAGDPAAWPLAEFVSVTGQTKKGREQAPVIRDLISAKPPAVTRVVATGDVLQSRCALTAIRATGDWAAALRGPVAEYLAGADLALSSLDGSIQGVGEPLGCVQTTNLTSPPEVIEALTLAGIDGMTVATNHAFDCGTAGCGSKALLESITRLNAVGIKTVGGGRNLEEALAPAIFEVNGVRFGVLGFDDIAAEDLEATETEPGTAPLDDSYANERADLPREPAFYKPAALLGVTRLQERVRALKQQVDVVIVQIQSGTEDTHDPSPRSIKALRAAAEAGADLIVGNQAHWVQAIEVRDDAFIAYALGNFIFDQTHTPEHTQGYLLEATFHGSKLATVRMVPYQIENKYRPVFVRGETRVKVLGDVIEAYGALPD